jgi:teichuronic acid biosynthesis glycosyltransferase TuaG
MSSHHNEPLVSVIIPAYNAADFLPFSIGSVIKQTYPNIEIVVIDDDSTDNTKSVIASLQSIHTSLRYIWQENGKQGKARNRGIQHAKGEYIAFLDADDEWLPEKIERQIDQLKQHHADLVFSDGILVKTSEKSALCMLSESGTETVKMGAFCGELFGQRGRRLLYRKNRIPTSSVLCRKGSILKAGGFVEDGIFQNCEDYLLWIRMVENGQRLVGFKDEFLLYRMHPGSSTINPLSSFRPLLNTLFIIKTPMPEDVRIQLAGHITGYIDIVDSNSLSDPDFNIFNQYIKNTPERLWRILMRLALRLGLNSLFYKLLRRHARKWSAKDVSDNLR